MVNYRIRSRASLETIDLARSGGQDVYVRSAASASHRGRDCGSLPSSTPRPLGGVHGGWLDQPEASRVATRLGRASSIEIASTICPIAALN
jgi:hypothetical protein